MEVEWHGKQPSLVHNALMAVTSLPSTPDVSLAPDALDGSIRGAGVVPPPVPRRAHRAPGEGWPPIAAGRHTLIGAPTGSGKTLAGFLVGIDRLYRAHEAGESIDGATRVVYLSR